MVFVREEIQLDFNNVLLCPRKSSLRSRGEVDLFRSFQFAGRRDLKTVPIIASNMDGVGTISMAKAFFDSGVGLTVALHKHYDATRLTEFFNSQYAPSAWYSFGMSEEDEEKFRCVIKEAPPRDDGTGVQKICIDVANGYMEEFPKFTQRIHKDFPDLRIMAGNVVTGEAVRELILEGCVDIVKVGIGSGSVCTTRDTTGVGRPQFSAVLECAQAAHEAGGLICSDGGCTVPGDLGKAFGGGADFVMLGGMLAGHYESEEKIVEVYGQKYVRFYGMSSRSAMEKHAGGMAEYRASEGKAVDIPFKGDVGDTVVHILGGVRSSCSLVGAENITELPERAGFLRVHQTINNVYGNSSVVCEAGPRSSRAPS